MRARAVTLTTGMPRRAQNYMAVLVLPEPDGPDT